MRYRGICEQRTSAERAKRDAEKRRAANAKRDAAQQRKNAAAHRYQDTMRSSRNDAIQSADNALANIKPSCCR